MKIRSLLAFGLIASLFALGACKKDEKILPIGEFGSLTGGPAPFARRSVKKKENTPPIGEFGSLTGGTATFGQSTHHGIMMATEEANEQGGLLGKKVKIFKKDDKRN